MNIDWETLFIPKSSLLELVIRGSIMYLMLFVMLRILVRRSVGTLGITDLLLIVLIADAAQNGMAGEYKSISEGVVLCLTIVGWSYLLDWLAYRSAWMRRWLEPPPLALIRNGRMQRKAMKQELITEDELLGQLRQSGVEDIKDVKAAYIESDGKISVIKKPADPADASPKKKSRGGVG